MRSLKERLLVLGVVAAIWGFVGIFILLASAIYRLAPMAFELPFGELSALHWAALLFSLVFMGFSEGYRGFQKNFSPRVAARIRYLRHHPTLLRTLLAPVFCMGFFYTTRKRKIVAFSLTTMIILLIILVHYIPQPWRGIIDAGVVLGLSWGLTSMAIYTIQAMVKDHFHHSPETPCNNTLNLSDRETEQNR